VLYKLPTVAAKNRCQSQKLEGTKYGSSHVLQSFRGRVPRIALGSCAYVEQSFNLPHYDSK